MLGKKKKLEEKMDTQVINLEAMKQVVSTEKKAKKQKSIALLLLFLGLFMIIMGILYPIIMDTLNGDDSSISTTENIENQSVSSNILTCTKVEEGVNSNKSIEEVFEFHSSKLTKFTTTTVITVNNDQGKQQIQQDVTSFNTLYGNIDETGVLKSVDLASDNSTLTTTFSIDYKQFDLVEYNKLHADSPLFVTYEENTSKNDIEKSMTSQGAICN